MGRFEKMRTASFIAFVVLIAACGRHREISPLPEAPGLKSLVALTPLDLKVPEDFDRLDRQILASGGASDLAKAYDDLARVAPDDPRILTRGALAALAADPEQRGPAVAAGVLKKLAKEAPGNADVAWLALRSSRLAQAPVGKPLKAASDGQAEAMRNLALDAAAFAAANAGWKGPFGATAEDAGRMALEAVAAVATWEASKAPTPGSDSPASSPIAPSGKAVEKSAVTK